MLKAGAAAVEITPTPLDGTLELPPGTVMAGTVEIGTTNGPGFALLETSNTLVTVTNSLAVQATGDVTNHIGATSSGLYVTNSAPDAFTIASGATVTIRFIAAGSESTGVHYGLRWDGDHTAALTALESGGQLVIDDAGLPAPLAAGILLYKGDSYVGYQVAAAGTVIILR